MYRDSRVIKSLEYKHNGKPQNKKVTNTAHQYGTTRSRRMGLLKEPEEPRDREESSF